MNKQQRAAIAGRIADVLRQHGAAVTIEDEPQYRCTRLDADFPGIVRVGLDIDDLHLGGALASWHSAAQRLNPSVFPGVNEYHGRKATSYAGSFDAMVAHLADLGACIAAGKAFAQPQSFIYRHTPAGPPAQTGDRHDHHSDRLRSERCCRCPRGGPAC